MGKNINLQPIEKESLYIKISDAVYNYIRVNHMEPGEKLPSEREMAAILQISRNSLREGLRILENQGLIDVRTGKGTFIKDPYGPESFFTIQLHGCKQEEIFELQEVLDHHIVEDAIANASKEDKAKLVEIALELVKMQEKGIFSHTIDAKFHTKLYSMARNSAIQQLINEIKNYRFIMQKEIDDNDEIWLEGVPNHLYLAKAIQNGDYQLALKEVDIINEQGFAVEKRKI